MSVLARISTIVVVFSLVIAATASAGMERVARRYTTMGLLGGYSQPQGEVDGIWDTDFIDETGRRHDLDADDVYDGSAHFAITYGNLTNRHMWLGFGFRYTDVAVKDTFWADDGQHFWYYPDEKPSIGQFDLDINFNYLFTDITQRFYAPYIGAGLRAGFTSFRLHNYNTEAEVNMALALNGGIEFKVYEPPSKSSFVTVVSTNSYDFWATGDRPRYLNFGLALKYYYRL
jgi:hypothetical protein